MLCRLLFSTVFFLLISLSFAESPKQAFEKLKTGNQRFVEGKLEFPNQSPKARKTTKLAQAPFAIIVACADSRVAPEIVFDQDIGDLFVIRVAGNVIGPYELESIQYAAKYLNSSYILVMGHQNCGAVKAVVDDAATDIPFIAQLIRPSVKKAKKSQAKDILKMSIEMNAETMVDFIMRCPEISKLQSQGKIEGSAAYYDFSTGQVKFL